MKKTIFLSILIVAAIAVSVGYYMFQKPVESLSQADSAWQGSSEELFEAFTVDEPAANIAYTGKILTVNGVVGETIVNADSSKTLILKSTDLLFGVKCRIDPKFNTKPIPSEGETVSLKGLCTGMNSDVELNQCILL